MKYGIVGLGNLGARIAANLRRAGFDLTVYDLNRAAVDRAAELGASPAKSVDDLAARVDALITCLPSPAASAAVVRGTAGAFAAMRPGSTWIEMSTIGVEEIKAFAVEAAAHGIRTLEAPMTGGLHRAAAGEITVFVGGPADLLETHRPALQAVAGPIHHIGDLGAASLLKVITNMLALTDLIAAGEALLLAKRGGLDLKRAYEAICDSSGSSVEFEDWAPAILSGSFNTGFTLDLALKDLGYTVDLGRKLEVPLQLTGLVAGLFSAARDQHGGSAFTPQVIAMMEQAAGVSLRAEGVSEVLPSPDLR